MKRSSFVRWFPMLAYLGLSMLVLAGCNDNTGFEVRPVLVSDTVTVYAPLPTTAGLPTALDITSDGAFGIRGGRFPEEIRDALQWDFAVRIVNGQMALVPARALDVPESRAGITQPLIGQTFEDLREAPPQQSLVLDSAVVMRVGDVYGARSREVGSFGLSCTQFSKLQPLEVNVATGLLRLRIVTNERCGDPRLATD
jgi:hypothetical protein